jgi:hypothetical protein
MRSHSERPAVVGAGLAAVVALLIAATDAAAKVRWFHSPSGNIECEVAAADDQRGTHAYCQTFDRPRSVKLRRDGTLRVCRGIACLGNGPTNASTLGHGESIRVGPFRCESLERGMRCRVIRSGRGFLLSKRRLKRL